MEKGDSEELGAQKTFKKLISGEFSRYSRAGKISVNFQ